MAKYLDSTGLTHLWSSLKEKLTLKVDTTLKINNKPLSSDITLAASDVGAVANDLVGKANGVASLGSDGKVPSDQLPETYAITNEEIDAILAG